MNKGIIVPSIKDKEGNIYSNIECIATFARDHILSASCLSRVLSGERKTHKGWKLA
jgi:hypothetical protein